MFTKKKHFKVLENTNGLSLKIKLTLILMAPQFLTFSNPLKKAQNRAEK